MMRSVLVLGLVTMTFTFDLDLDAHWMSFKKTYGKDYHQQEEIVRKVIFKENVDYIQRHNLQADMGKYTYWLGINEYADWSHEEFVKFMNGFNPRQNRTKTKSATFLPPNYLVLPATVDWREKGYVTGVKNQKKCGACWAFSATGALEGQHFKKTGKLVSLSEQNLVDCSISSGNFGCHGGLPSNAFDYVRLNAGIDTEVCYPYEAKDEKCRFKSTCVGSICVGYQDVTPHGNETALQTAVASVGPISVAIDAGHKSFQLYKSGVYNEPNCSSSHLDHGVLAVGYGTYQGQPYWLVKNSWGPSWGLKGYVMMTRNKNNQCGIATMATYPWV